MGEQDNREYIYQQPQQQPQRVIPPENQVEFLKFVLDPTTRAQYTHITKDLAVSNADAPEIAYLHVNLQLLHLVDFVEIGHGKYKKVANTENSFKMLKEPDLDPTRHVILKDIYSYLQLLRSKGGFERQIEATQILKQFSSIKEEPLRKGWFGR